MGWEGWEQKGHKTKLQNTHPMNIKPIFTQTSTLHVRACQWNLTLKAPTTPFFHNPVPLKSRAVIWPAGQFGRYRKD